ncbi:MAG: TetR/AcrR family transcriptional regulator [Trueperaceae bacterium]|nr:TetR/AcrR family transcriptional regulator [Trueperaceae bacterium]
MNRKANMSSSKQDRRSKRSKQLLFDALMELILEKGYETITVTDITERADVARGTFYLHYKDKDELLLSSFDKVADGILENVKRFSKQDLLAGVPHPALSLFEYVYQDPTLFRVILNGQGGALMLQRFRIYASETAQQSLKNMNILPAVPPHIVADFVAGAMLSVLGSWLESGMKTPPQEMARLFYRLIRPSILSALALE